MHVGSIHLGQLLEKIIPIQLEGKATGGSTSTIADSSLPGNYDDDSFKNALAFVHSTTDGAAPQNEFSVVSAYVDSSGTFTVDTALSAAVGAGDYYAIADPQYKKAAVLRVVNDALRNFGIISLVDISLTTANNTLEYTLPLAVKAFPIDRIEIGNSTDGWDELTDWYVVPAGAGTQAKLVFNRQPIYDETTPSNCTLRIWYRDYHPALDTYDDKISETIPDKRFVFDRVLVFAELGEDIAKRPYITVGFTAWTMLVVLAATSPLAMVRRLGGKRWQRLHRLVYLAVPLVVLHFAWAQKKDLAPMLPFVAALAAVVALRLAARAKRLTV